MPSTEEANAIPNRPQLPPTVSPVLGQLSDFVELNFIERSNEIKFLIVCIAYTTYCREKKNYIKDQLKDDNIDAVRKRLLSYSFAPFKNDEYYRKLSTAADSELQEIFRSEYASIIDDASSAIQRKLDPAISAINTLKIQLQPLSDSSAHIVACVTPTPPPPPKTSRQIVFSVSEKAFHFLVFDSLKHFIITVIMIFGWAIGIVSFIDNFIPYVRNAISTTIAHEIQIFAPKESASAGDKK